MAAMSGGLLVYTKIFAPIQFIVQSVVQKMAAMQIVWQFQRFVAAAIAPCSGLCIIQANYAKRLETSGAAAFQSVVCR